MHAGTTFFIGRTDRRSVAIYSSSRNDVWEAGATTALFNSSTSYCIFFFWRLSSLEEAYTTVTASHPETGLGEKKWTLKPRPTETIVRIIPEDKHGVVELQSRFGERSVTL